ncbi:MAG: hypothetical protein HY319_04790 [Armatimonadetes bacterium]|nr:hypothetical protein [Armatimonadota bacterium]
MSYNLTLAKVLFKLAREADSRAETYSRDGGTETATEMLRVQALEWTFRAREMLVKMGVEPTMRLDFSLAEVEEAMTLNQSLQAPLAAELKQWNAKFMKGQSRIPSPALQDLNQQMAQLQREHQLLQNAHRLLEGGDWPLGENG